MRLTPLCAALLSAPMLAPSLAAQGMLGQLEQQDYTFEEREDGWIVAADATGTYAFATFQEYVGSSFFRDHGLRCGADRLLVNDVLLPDATSDCSNAHTSILSQYNPNTSTPVVIPVWVHILRNNAGTLGNVSQSQITSQITALNVAFASSGVQFVLAGQDTSNNTRWYNDSGTYYNTLAKDVNNYLNIYTNLAGGNLGYAYVPNGGGVVGNKFDRVVIYYRAFGNPGTYGAPYNEGDTTVHEVGHYLGLYHTFQGGCAAASNCSNNGDLICDTNPEGSPNFSPCTRNSACGPWLDPTTNFMDYSDDVCMFQFSSNQMNRMNCTIQNWRTRIPSSVP